MTGAGVLEFTYTYCCSYWITGTPNGRDSGMICVTLIFGAGVTTACYYGASKVDVVSYQITGTPKGRVSGIICVTLILDADYGCIEGYQTK